MEALVNVKETMSSIEIAELTGREHKNVMAAIRSMEPAWQKVNGLKFKLVDYTDKKGEKRPCYELNKTECLYIATKFNDEARAKLVLRWEELETEKQKELVSESKEPKPISPRTLQLMKLDTAKWLIKNLNYSDTAKLALAKAIAEPLELPVPTYAKSKGVIHSATDRLKERKISLSARKFNQMMINAGMMERASRYSRSKGKNVAWSVLIGEGLNYGENGVHPDNPRQTQPSYYDDKFDELLSILGITNKKNN